MMGRGIRAAGLGVAVVCALLALTASAFATENLPAFGKCTAMAGGRYRTAGCTKLAKTTEQMKYEWGPLSSAVNFTEAKERATGNAVLEGASGIQISCTGQSAAGEYGPGNEVKNVVDLFTGCEGGGLQCNSEGQPAGHVVTKKLHGEPGVIKKEVKEEKNIDGVDLRSEEGGNLAEFFCGPISAIVKGGLLVGMQADSTGGTSGELTNKMVSKVELEYLGEGAGKQASERWTPNGGGVSNSEHNEIAEHLEMSLLGEPFEAASMQLVTVRSTSPSTVKVELRQCESNIVC
jgi:hypothetical protein